MTMLHDIAGLVLGMALMVGGLMVGPVPASAVTTERIVVDRHTGLAIFGYDPVAYFVDGAVREGRGGIELRHDGAIWRFRNVGNRDAFTRDPDVYRPRYGGYDPTAVAQGFGTQGHPQVWLIHDDRLYLFRDAASRRLFQSDPQGMIRAADRRWPQILEKLAP